jgi:ligand-binding sensor domain-containing protein
MRKSAAIGVLLAMAMSAGAEPGQASIALPVTDGTDLRFNHLALGTDPSHRRITGFAQDDFGFLWMGTDDGLMRYDGYRIRAFRQDPGNPNSLGDTYVIALFKDRSGKLWVPTAARLLDVYNPVMETFTPFRTNGRSGDRLSARVGEVNQDRAGTIWLATDDGLY